MNFLPLHFDLQNKSCLVVGGGEVASRKIELLVRVKANITVVAPDVCASIKRLIDQGAVKWQTKAFADADIHGQALVIAATNKKEVNRQVSDIAHAQNTPVNVVDAPELCSVIFPAIVDRNPLIISISSGGTSPVFARFMRGQIESVVHERFGDLAKLLETYRGAIRAKFPELSERRAFTENCLNNEIAQTILNGHLADGEALLKQALSAETATQITTSVHVINCPPEADLLTFRALRVMQQADVVFYSEHVNPNIVDLARRDAPRLPIGQDLCLDAFSDKHVVWLQEQTSSFAPQIINDVTLGSLMDSSVKQGEVYLVGGGPGDPELLTFKALRLMQQADVVLYDRLVSPQILALSNPQAEKIFVGKEQSNHPVPQEEINNMLIRLAQEGKRVLRLKGGDPFIFGRGGEEIKELCEHNIPFQVVPGITAANACSTYAGIPLTHRDYAQSVRFVAGHVRKDGQSDINWQNLCVNNETLVFYMGLHQLAVICEKLIANGMSSDMPVALIQAGSLPEQDVITGTLADIQTKLEAHPLKPPTLIIVGRVVRLREKLSWFDSDN